MDNHPNKMTSWAIFILLCLVWGSSFILIKRALIAFNPFQIAGLRMVIAAIILLPFVVGKAKKLTRNEWRYVMVVGLIGNGIPAFLFPLAETHINSATAGILNALSPLFVLLIGFILFNFRFSTQQVVGVILGLAGAMILILSGEKEINLLENTFYTFLVIIATVLYGFTTNIMKRHLNHTPSVLASGFALLTISVPYSIYLLFSGLPEVFATHEHAWASLGYVSILSALGTAVSLVLFYRLVQMTGPIFASSVTYFIPVVALMWGLLDGERFSMIQFAGMGVILVGVYLANRK
ncbi:MAG: EamA family transporter [Bacteroidia bacterium]|nr:EamA family transporter [Bacteroidia bacterium]